MLLELSCKWREKSLEARLSLLGWVQGLTTSLNALWSPILLKDNLPQMIDISQLGSHSSAPHWISLDFKVGQRLFTYKYLSRNKRPASVAIPIFRETDSFLQEVTKGTSSLHGKYPPVALHL